MQDQRDDEAWTTGLDTTGFAGHDADNQMLHLSIPELAGAQTVGQAAANGSPRARRQARIMGWLLLAPLLLAIVFGLASAFLF